MCVISSSSKRKLTKSLMSAGIHHSKPYIPNGCLVVPQGFHVFLQALIQHNSRANASSSERSGNISQFTTFLPLSIIEIIRSSFEVLITFLVCCLVFKFLLYFLASFTTVVLVRGKCLNFVWTRIKVSQMKWNQI